MSPTLPEKFGTAANQVVNKVSGVKLDRYTLFAEYAIRSSSIGPLITLLSGNSGDYDL